MSDKPETVLGVEQRTYLQDFVKKACGLVISDAKEYLFKFRLGPIITRYGYAGFEELCEQLRTGNKNLREEVITELTTHETFFFRDRHPFETFRTHLLPWLVKNVEERKKKSFIRKGSKASIWCAASSTGQEPYSLAMQIRECAKTTSLNPEDVSILASDVSTKVLADAMNGVYMKFEVERGTEGRDFNKTFRSQYLKPVGNNYEVVDELKQMIDFKYCNLTEPFESLGGFDIIFSRNVLIYFDEETKKRIISQFHKMLSPGGYLLLGSSENIFGLSDMFETEHVGETLLYRKRD